MKKLISSVVVASALVAGATLFGATGAQAAAHDGTCDWTESCVYRAWNYLGGLADEATNDPDWRNDYFTTGYNLNDQASSGFGNERAQQYYNGISYTSYWFVIGYGKYDPKWSTNQEYTSYIGFDFNDKVSSNSLYVPV